MGRLVPRIRPLPVCTQAQTAVFFLNESVEQNDGEGDDGLREGREQ